MFRSLTTTQRQIALEKEGQFVVRACPGSGKTYAVAARLAHQLPKWNKRAQGIAALSFTNVAWREIERKLSKNFSQNVPLRFPHFLGTLDSFINQFIFLPFGHHLLNCTKRPTLVGAPHSSWAIKRFERDYDQYFDKISYGVNDELVFPNIPNLFFFPFKQFYKIDGSESQHAVNMRAVKKRYWAKGYASQDDANYFAYRILEKFPNIARALVYRFPNIILDEAQDTNEIHMKILDKLIEHGLNEIALIGDQDQAIFEWNEAKPALFREKYNTWADNSVELNENMRSSQKICNVTKKLSTLSSTSRAINDTVRDLSIDPEIWVYDRDNVRDIVATFISKCESFGISVEPQTVAVIYRSKSFYNDITGITSSFQSPSPWLDEDFLTQDIAKGAYLYHQGFFKEGFNVMERSLIKLLLNKSVVTADEHDKEILKTGFKDHRSRVVKMLSDLPHSNLRIGDWIASANPVISSLCSTSSLRINDTHSGMNFSDIFPNERRDASPLPYTLGTVHSVKGETFDATLVLLREKVSKNYRTLLAEDTLQDKNEELRIVYVGLTRPRKFVVLAVPNEKDKASWSSKLFH